MCAEKQKKAAAYFLQEMEKSENLFGKLKIGGFWDGVILRFISILHEQQITKFRNPEIKKKCRS